MPNLYKTEPTLEFTRHGYLPIIGGQLAEVVPKVVTLNMPILADSEEAARQQVSNRIGVAKWLNGDTQEEAEAKIMANTCLTYVKPIGEIKVTLIKENATDEDVDAHIASIQKNRAK